ncbi:hypothetical protein HanRHA438_Chr13g0615461 [Helianthus annuus]|nr:hypothetical protein HanRHA438_Chr13g0615461 [Helianthus annuus]
MYCFCHNLHHSSAADDHSQQLEGPPPPHECRGIWFYHCFCHFHPPPPHNLSGDRTTHMPHKNESERYLNNKSTHRVYCKHKTDHSLSICEGKVILAPTNQWRTQDFFFIGVHLLCNAFSLPNINIFGSDIVVGSGA